MQAEGQAVASASLSAKKSDAYWEELKERDVYGDSLDL